MQDEEQRLLSVDAKYRNYASLIEKALKSFEYTNEWADLISALAKVTKVIASHKKYVILPKKIIIGKRLAQCLHPALPAGVHLKALELYETIFTTVDKDILVRDFPIYSAGILPLMSHAAMTVKPVLYRLYEEHILPIGVHLKTAASGIILGLLPGLEEGSEFYERTNSLCERFSDVLGVEHFYTNLWSCLVYNSSVRLAGTTYFLTHIDKSKSIEDQLFLLGNDLSLLVQALKACLEDSAVLVQRNTLDVLSSAFPFHSSPLTKHDQADIIQSALLVLLRRDMSLNRRLYGWLLGVTTTGTSMLPKNKLNKQASTSSEGQTNRQRHDSGSSSASEPELEYFNLHSRKYLVQSLRSYLDSVNGAETDVIKPIRIIISLLDRVEIGSVVLEDILINIFRLIRKFYSSHLDKVLPGNTDMATYKLVQTLDISLKTYSRFDVKTSLLPPKTQTELLKTCNLLFGTLEPPFLWEYLADTYERVIWPSGTRSLNPELSLVEFCDMVSMILNIVPLEGYIKTKTVYLPRLLSNLLTMLKENLVSLSLKDVTHVLLLARQLLNVITPAQLSNNTEEDHVETQSVHTSLPSVLEILNGLLQMRKTQIVNSEDFKYAFACLSLLLIEISSFPVYDSASSSEVEEDKTTSSGSISAGTSQWIHSLIELSASSESEDTSCQFISTSLLLDLISLYELTTLNESSNQSTVSSQSGHRESPDLVFVIIKPPITRDICDKLRIHFIEFFSILWHKLDAEDSSTCSEASFLLACLIGSANDSRDMEKVVMKELVHKDIDVRLLAYRKFSLFWHLTRDMKSVSMKHLQNTLMVVLSSLLYEAELIKEVVYDWLMHSVECSDMNRIVEPLLIQLLEADTSRSSVQTMYKTEGRSVKEVDRQTLNEEKFQDSLTAARNKIHAISSDGKVVLQSDKAGKKPGQTQVRQSMITKDGQISPAPQHVDEPLACENAMKYSSAGLALNPFGDVSDLDHIIFDGFTPHQSLKSKWAEVTTKSSPQDYHAIVSKAKRLNQDICEKEGIDFSAINSSTESDEIQDVEGKHQIVTEGVNQTHGGKLEEADDSGNESDDVNGSHEDTQCASTTIPLGLSEPSTSKPEAPEPPPLTDPEVEYIVQSILDDIIGQVTANQSDAVKSADGPITELNPKKLVPSSSIESSLSSIAESSQTEPEKETQIKQEGPQATTPISDKPALGSNAYILIYDQCYDCNRVTFAFTLLKALLRVSPASIISSLTSSTCSSVHLLSLYAKHKKSLEGGNFYTAPSQEELVSLRNTRLLEVFVVVSTYYWRSYHSVNHTPDGCIQSNSQVQLLAVDLLMTLITDLELVLADSPKGFPQFMVDVLQRCKVQKTCVYHLHSLYSRTSEQLQTVCASHIKSVDVPLLTRTLRLTEKLIKLEANLQRVHNSQTCTTPVVQQGSSHVLLKRHIFSHSNLTTSLLNSLKDATQAKLHHQWLTLVANSLAFVQTLPETPRIITKVVNTVCGIIDSISNDLLNPAVSKKIPPDYVKQMLEDLTAICHFCFMDATSNLVGQSEAEDNKSAPISTGQLLSNLVHVFNPLSSTANRHTTPPKEPGSKEEGFELQHPKEKCRDELLSRLPKILSSLSLLWRVCQKLNKSKEVKLIVEFFSPILHHYTEQLLGSIAVVWSDSEDARDSSQVQTTLVDLLLSIKALPMDIIVNKLSSVMRKPPNTDHITNARVVLQISSLRFLRGYISKLPAVPTNSLSSLCNLLKQCLLLGLPANGTLLLQETVYEFVMKLGNIEDRKLLRELQDIVGKVLEACCQIASSQLEASSWIRKNYTVKTRIPLTEGEAGSSTQMDTSGTLPGIRVEAEATEEHGHEATAAAISLLAEVTASLLDVVFPSEDKDKIPGLLTNILARIFPYLRNHSLLNMSCFRASSKLIASISSYQYTRRTWKREVYDLLLLPNFFQMDIQSLHYWKILTDSLVTQDKHMFRDLIGKFSIAVNSSLPLFHNKDAELIQRAHNLKKLAFILYSGEVDHYRPHMPEIQERLSENLRLKQAPAVISNVFLFFRVLLLRMSPSNLTSLWPTIIAELVYVMNEIENDLSLTDDEEQQFTRISEIDSASCLRDGVAHNSPQWLQLYLSACKLLDLLLILPARYTPEFQHYSWMFIGSEDTDSIPPSRSDLNGERGELFVGCTAHIPSILFKMKHKYGEYQSKSLTPNKLLLQEQTISSLRDLQAFFTKSLLIRGSGTSTRKIMKDAETVIDNDIVEAPS